MPQLYFGGTNAFIWEETGTESPWVRSVKGTNLDKRFATIMPTFVAEGKQTIKPVIIFRGAADERSDGKEMSRARKRERKRYNKGVEVFFQVSCDLICSPGLADSLGVAANSLQ